jgi:hypothetical protein
MLLPFVELAACTTLLCSRLPLMYNLVGLMLPLIKRGWFYYAASALLLQAVATAFELSVSLPVGLAHFVCGGLLGSLLRWLGIQLAPIAVQEHKHALLWFCGELLCCVLAFAYVDSVVPESGFNYGIWLSLILALIWWGAVFFVNTQRLAAPESADFSETQNYQRSFSALLVCMLCFFGTYLFYILPHYAAALLGALFSMLIITALQLY